MPSPAEKVLAMFAARGVTIPQLAAELGVAKTTVYRWREPCKPRAGGAGCDGRIPAKHYAPLLRLAKRYRVKLRPHHLVTGE